MKLLVTRHGQTDWNREKELKANGKRERKNGIHRYI